MFWPRLTHVKPGFMKYWNPQDGRPAPLRRMYAGSLESTQTQRRPFFPFQIAREAHVFALTAIGDLHQFRIALEDSSGETYFTDPTLATSIFGGFAYSGAQGANTGVSSMVSDGGIGPAITICPFVLEPALVLKPNQALNIVGVPVRSYQGQDYRMDFTIHVWEY